MQTNEYQIAARLKKAQALTNALVAGRITSELARAMTDDDWLTTANACQLKSPPSETTRALVLDQLQQMERIKNGGKA